ncbi:MAG TPA: hypothetical protein VMT20_13810 [Terriglobia bacterium]|nr:hypothetical protein [Terriglobia bacterium]
MLSKTVIVAESRFETTIAFLPPATTRPPAKPPYLAGSLKVEVVNLSADAA